MTENFILGRDPPERIKWRQLAPIGIAQIVQLFDTGRCPLVDRDGDFVLELVLPDELLNLDPKPWREIVLAVARRVPESSL